MVVIAQLAEHRIVVPSVVGSSPTIHPKTLQINGLQRFFVPFLNKVRQILAKKSKNLKMFF